MVAPDQHHWLRLLRQLRHDELNNSLKTCNKILSTDNTDQLAIETKASILVGLNQYNQVLDLYNDKKDTSSDIDLQCAYCHYKLLDYAKAHEILDEYMKKHANDPSKTRAALSLLAQIKYRQHEFEECKSTYHNLLLNADQEDLPSEMVADFQDNLETAQTYLNFIDDIPQELGNIHSLPPITALEAKPLVDLISAFNLTSNRPAVYQQQQQSSKGKQQQDQKQEQEQKEKTDNDKKPKEPKTLPKSIAELPPDQRPTPDPERWLPKHERTSYRPPAANNNNNKRSAKEKKKEAALTQGQGSSLQENQKSANNSAAQSSSNNKKKKKKGR